MELISFTPTTRFIAVVPMARTKPETITINPSLYCRVCSIKSKKAKQHDANALHTSTVRTYMEED